MPYNHAGKEKCISIFIVLGNVYSGNIIFIVYTAGLNSHYLPLNYNIISNFKETKMYLFILYCFIQTNLIQNKPKDKMSLWMNCVRFGRGEIPYIAI